MNRNCLHCQRPFTPAFDTDAFCGTWCSQSWWMSSTAGAEWEAIEQSYRDEWDARTDLY